MSARARRECVGQLSEARASFHPPNFCLVTPCVTVWNLETGVMMAHTRPPPLHGTYHMEFITLRYGWLTIHVLCKWVDSNQEGDTDFRRSSTSMQEMARLL